MASRGVLGALVLMPRLSRFFACYLAFAQQPTTKFILSFLRMCCLNALSAAMEVVGQVIADTKADLTAEKTDILSRVVFELVDLGRL